MGMAAVETLESAAPTVLKPKFRHYAEEPLEDPIQQRVRNHYYMQHRFQTVEVVEQKRAEWLTFSRARLGILECLDLLDEFVDHSDPDLDDANRIHAYQTAERMRAAFPDQPHMHLAGLIHDMGKLMSVWGEQQHFVTGDTYPVGCRPAESIVYGLKSFEGNPDLHDSRYNTRLGMYQEGCGLESLLMCWSHDEYLYQVLKNHPDCTLPQESLYAIRFHSFYPYHQGNEYAFFQTERDVQMRQYIHELNEHDLYSKADNMPPIEDLKPYYQELIERYVPGILAW
ncbi:Inositol oxygenase [Aphelenchoides fujianensis]|nr:Inositol oxygenase [Aphelenchoides fujianensis]